METAASWRRHLLLLLLLLPLSPLSVSAQGAAGSLQVVAVDTGRPERLAFAVSLPPGTEVRQANEFALLEDSQEVGRATGLQPFRDSGWMLSTVLAVDTSGSVRRYVGDISAALPEFVMAHPPNDTFAVVTFDDNAQVAVPFESSRDQVSATLSGLTARGRRTLLYSGLERSLQTLEAVPRARTWRRVLLISDGADESGERPDAADALIAQAARGGIVVDTIWIGQPAGAARNTLIRIAERTGGVHGDAARPEQIAADLRAALVRARQRVDQAVVVGFDRQVDTASLTDQIGVRLARPGITSAQISLQVPRSAPPDVGGSDTSESLTPRLVRILLRVLLAALLAFFGYAAVRVIFFKERIQDAILIWHRPAREETPVVTSAPPEPPAKPVRQTVVGAPAPFVVPGTAPRALTLEGLEGPLMGHRIPVPGPRFRIGAAKDNDLQIASDKYMSGAHAVIQPSKTGWMVVDKGSSNGTFVDGRKVGPSGHELRDGQRLRVGGSEFRVQLGVASPVAGPVGGSTPAEPGPR